MHDRAASRTSGASDVKPASKGLVDDRRHDTSPTSAGVTNQADGQRLTTSASAKPLLRIPGEEGIWVFVLGDMAVFALFFATFMYSRARNSATFANDHGSLNVVLGTTNTVLLLTSSLLVALGVQHVLAGTPTRATRLFGGAVACGVSFIAIKGVEWSHLFIQGKTASIGEYYSYYFVFTGIHLLHVVVGIIVLFRLLALSRRTKITARQELFCETGGIFWHMVDLLWVVLFALFYLVR